MKTKISFRRIMRLGAVLSTLLLFLVPSLCVQGTLTVQVLIPALLVGNFILLLYPMSDEKSGPALAWSVLMTVLVMLSEFLLREIPPVIPASAVLLLNLIWRVLRRSDNFRVLFRNDAPIFRVEEMTLLIRTAAVTFLCLYCMFCPGWIPAVFAAALLAAQYYVVYSGRLVVLRRSREECLRNIIKGDLRTNTLALCDEDMRMSAMYSRLIVYMEEKKPYLEEGFDLSKCARMMFSNKTYLSKVVNYYSGRNFKQFVNYYRVKYSVELIKKDPRLSVMELAQMSGFHSTVTYTVAFRANMNDTPGSFSKNCIRG